MMKNLIITLALICATPASAACYADYKAKKGNPLQLHYGVIQVPDNACNVGAAGGYIAGRIASQGWELLTVLSVFDDSGLSQRRAEAGQFFLRF